jgi:hypothetical protein
MNTIDTDLEKQLTRVYVALAMTRDVAQRGVTSKPADPDLSSLLTLLDVASEMLEDILDPALELWPEESAVEVSELETVM